MNKQPMGEHCRLQDTNSPGMFVEKYWRNAIHAREFLVLSSLQPFPEA